jgi:small-conductance mechanosensitive channel
MRWLETTLLVGVPLLTALGIALLVFFGLLLLRRLIVRRASKVAARTATDLDNLLVELARRTRPLLMAVPAVYLGSLALAPPPRVAEGLRVVTILAVLLQVALWATVALDHWVARTRRRRLEQDATTVSLLGVLRFVLKLVLWSVLLLVALDNFGVDVTALIAGLGIGGVAVALALQNVLGDLLASLSIVLDKPFVIGDSITVDTMTGTVENIGLKTTRLRAVSGEQIVIANGELLKSRIRNWARLTERQVTLGFAVAYPAPADKLEKIPGLVQAIIESQDQVRFDRAHLKGFGQASLDFEAVYKVLSPDFKLHMDRQQAILLELLRTLEREGLELAHPAPTVLVQGGGGEDAPEGARQGRRDPAAVKAR